MTWTEVDGQWQCMVGGFALQELWLRQIGAYIVQVKKASGPYWVWRAFRDGRFADSGRAYTLAEAQEAATRYAETFA